MSAPIASGLVLDEAQRLLQKTARDFVRSESPARRVRSLRDARDPLGFSPDLWKRMAELGFVGMSLPEACGGLGAPFFDFCVVLTELGRELQPEPLVTTVLLGAHALVLGGSAQAEALLPAVARGEALVALAHDEAGGRWDPSRVAVAARADGSGFALSGTKLHVLDAPGATHLVVSARSAGAPGERDGVGLFLVGRDAPGVSLEREWRVDSRAAATVRLDGVRLGAEALLGSAIAGVDLLERVLDRAAIGLAAEMLGGALSAFDRTLDHLAERRQFGVPIGSFQALQHRIARLYVELALCRSAVLGAARSVDDAPADVPRMAALAKARASETFVAVANDAIQMHGGIGMTDEHDIGLYLKRARAAELTLGDAPFHRKRWAELSGY